MFNPVIAQQLAEMKRTELIAEAERTRLRRLRAPRRARPVRGQGQWWRRLVAVRRAAVL
ncbi:MAG TPA: hypothetical protein VFZ63_13800 [Jiangellaceae bacterium]